ncbi:UMF1 family MFS transporter [Propionibacteriaceae bacterium ES.041]|uniref:MFS transporter n=1 Tax=Enemella evansiae TaxID=2016499 RepID=UPI000B96A6B9|nr:MFS transporter [Enemella evansiae]OYN98103.1 MFS transporter [Enemella evansiae]OYO02282.1 MFS transporter [Enemella evansiae]PFG66988.1 UMF1 family MFS transporter [Propionibacteriaceae bacterium ES.041]
MSTVTSAPAHGDRRTVISWCLWDFGSNAFNTVMLSFVFSVYVTSAVAESPERGQQVFANWQTVAGIVVALAAPVVGAWGDRVRNRKAVLGVLTLIVVACVAACWFVRPEDQYLFLGAGLIAGAQVAQGMAEIFYNAMLSQISTPTTIGRISGLAWGLGYFGGVICLVVAAVGFVQNAFGLPTADSINIRGIALFCAAWLLLMSIPVMFFGPPALPRQRSNRFSPLRAYAEVVRILRGRPKLAHFLLASAIYRDGLTAVFTFAGVIAATSYGFAPTEVLYFGLAANIVAAVGTWVFGSLDDRLGPRPVIVGTLIAMVITGLIIVLFPAKLVFWIGGMVISSMVGAVQSASRTLLVRILEPGEENEIFGLYATVGRAVSFLAPALVALFTAMFGVRLGLLGIIVTLLLGLAVFWPLRITGVTHDRVSSSPPAP